MKDFVCKKDFLSYCLTCLLKIVEILQQNSEKTVLFRLGFCLFLLLFRFNFFFFALAVLTFNHMYDLLPCLRPTLFILGDGYMYLLNTQNQNGM